MKKSIRIRQLNVKTIKSIIGVLDESIEEYSQFLVVTREALKNIKVVKGDTLANDTLELVGKASQQLKGSIDLITSGEMEKSLAQSISTMENFIGKNEKIKRELASSLNDEDLKIYPWEHKMRYDRGVENISTSEHIVAFIDILGFKNLLDEGEFNRILSYFEQIADETMMLRRHYNLLSCSEIMPRMDNFSDSIILSSVIYPDNEKYLQVNSLIFDIFIQLCQTIIVTGLRMGISVRGCIEVGEYFSRNASSVKFESVSRWGQGSTLGLFKSIWHEAGLEFPQDEKPADDEQLPQIRIPVHFGSALTKAYQLESKIKNIGIFLRKDLASLSYVSSGISEDRILCITSSDTYAINWCKLIYHDEYLELMEYIRDKMSEFQSNEYVLEKWSNLYLYAKSAPTK